MPTSSQVPHNSFDHNHTPGSDSRENQETLRENQQTDKGPALSVRRTLRTELDASVRESKEVADCKVNKKAKVVKKAGQTDKKSNGRQRLKAAGNDSKLVLGNELKGMFVVMCTSVWLCGLGVYAVARALGSFLPGFDWVNFRFEFRDPVERKPATKKS
jgi:hypothetical protein